MTRMAWPGHAELKQRAESAEARVRELEAENVDIRNLNAVAARTAHDAESECAVLRAEVERLRMALRTAGLVEKALAIHVEAVP